MVVPITLNLNPSKEFVALGAAQVKLWDTEGGVCLQTYDQHTGNVTACAWLPDGQAFLTGSDDKCGGPDANPGFGLLLGGVGPPEPAATLPRVARRCEHLLHMHECQQRPCDGLAAA